MYIYPSNRKDKRFKAIFHDGLTVHFGSKNGQTYIDHRNDTKRVNYIKRHRELNEDWTNPYTSGTLSRYLLWEYPTLKVALREYKKKYSIK